MLTKEDFEHVQDLKKEGYQWPQIAKSLNMPVGFLKREYMNWLREQRNEHYREKV